MSSVGDPSCYLSLTKAMAYIRLGPRYSDGGDFEAFVTRPPAHWSTRDRLDAPADPQSRRLLHSGCGWLCNFLSTQTGQMLCDSDTAATLLPYPRRERDQIRLRRSRHINTTALATRQLSHTRAGPRNPGCSSASTTISSNPRQLCSRMIL